MHGLAAREKAAEMMLRMALEVIRCEACSKITNGASCSSICSKLSVLDFVYRVKNVNLKGTRKRLLGSLADQWGRVFQKEEPCLMSRRKAYACMAEVFWYSIDTCTISYNMTADKTVFMGITGAVKNPPLCAITKGPHSMAVTSVTFSK